MLLSCDDDIIWSQKVFHIATDWNTEFKGTYAPVPPKSSALWILKAAYVATWCYKFTAHT